MTIKEAQEELKAKKEQEEKEEIKKGVRGCLLTVVITLTIFFLIVYFIAQSHERRNNYNKTLENGVDKAYSGDYNSMSKEERDAADGFFKWQEKNGY